MNRARTNISDVAREAGVSKATVSRVLGANYPVSPATKKAVEDAVEKLGYTASVRARSLATGRADAIAVIVSEPLDNIFGDQTFAKILRGITEAMSETEIVPILLSTVSEAEQRKALRLVTNQAVDAVIHISPWADAGLLNALATEQVPTVICGQSRGISPEIAQCFAFVYSDDFTGAKLAAQYLSESGVKNPVAILGVPTQPASIDRLAGYRKIFPELTEQRVVSGSWTELSGASGIQKFITDGVSFDAVLAGSDRIAQGVNAALRGAGINVPQEVKVIGYDDNLVATEISPYLTTIAQPMLEQGRVAFELAQELIAGQMPREVVLPTELIIRESA
ncbi:MAG: LacI family DNA-binding transcriptional regulator [Arcanobacterium sp.]|nr:LacI family DNA-binding transcriptional regulator [Arcanobacterium sp.]